MLWYPLPMKTDPALIIEQLQAEAFQEGWDQLAQKIKVVLESPFQKSLKSSINSLSENPFETGSGSAKVYDYVKANPSLRGRDIIKGTGVEGKTVRTCLHRMKTRGIAINENGRWRIL